MGWGIAVLGPVLLTVVLSDLGDVISLPTELMLFLALTVLVALVGGLWPAIVSAVVGFLLLNWFFTAPTGRLTIADPENALALGVFVLVAVGVASVVDLAARRTTEAFRARAEASALAAVSRSVLSADDTAAAVVARLRETFTLEAVSLLTKHGSGWDVLATDGIDPALAPEDAQVVLAVDDERVLALTGRVLAGERPAGARGVRLPGRRRARAGTPACASRAGPHPRQADATRTALLAAVSHDLRTPLATIRASVDGLTSTDLRASTTRTGRRWSDTLEESTARLERLIDNLLDLSRLQTGSVRPVLRATSLDEIVPFAIEGYPPGAVTLDVPDDLPLVRTDPGSWNASLRTSSSNAVRHARAGSPVVVNAAVVGGDVVVRVVDDGPGVPDDVKEHMFEAFQRLGDTTGNGLGLGLAVADGLSTAVGAELSVEDTPGGGLTMLVTVPLAEQGA